MRAGATEYSGGLLGATALEWKAGLLGGAVLTIGYILETAGMQEATAAKSGFLAQFYVVLVPFLQAAVFRRRPAWADLGSLLLATAGIGVMVVRPGQEVSIGEVLVALSAITWAIQIVLVGRVAQRVDPIRISVVQILVIAVLSSLSLAFVHEPMPTWRPALIGHVIFLAVGCSSIGFLVQAWAQRSVSPTRTAVLYSAQPIFSLAFGAWLLGEAFDGRDLAGAALVMAAVAVAVLAPKNDTAAPAAGS